MDLSKYKELAIETLKQLVSTQSCSGEEENVAEIINSVLTKKGYKTHRKKNLVTVSHEFS